MQCLYAAAQTALQRGWWPLQLWRASSSLAGMLRSCILCLHLCKPKCLPFLSMDLHTVFAHAFMNFTNSDHHEEVVSGLTKCIAVQFLQHLLAEEAWLHARPHLLQ